MKIKFFSQVKRGECSMWRGFLRGKQWNGFRSTSTPNPRPELFGRDSATLAFVQNLHFLTTDARLNEILSGRTDD
jgi:hypothetical protein